MKLRIIAVVVGAITLLFCNTTQAQNGIEPRYERYNADRKSIEVDGDLSDWAGVAFIQPRFEASDGREAGKGNSTIGDVTYSTFAEFAGGTWSGPDDHTTLTAVAWDQNGLYLGIVVTDDEHEHAAGNAWNGDGVQMGLTDADRSTVTHLYNYCIKDGYESGKVYKNGDAGIIADKEKGPGNYSVAMVRDDAKKTTTYEALFTPDSFGFTKFEVGQQFGFGVCVNDGDKDTPGQKGWSGWGPHMIVFGKTAQDAALVTLTAAEVLASFETDFSDGEIPETAELFGTATIGPDELDEADEPNEFLHVTDAENSQNGAMKIQDITDGRTFKEFEVGFRLYISDSTCCGDEDDMSPAHRPADGWSLSIGNDLPDTIGLPEEGTGNGIRICFDTWDSGGGEAPAIDVWNGVDGEVGDGDQDGWSGGLFARQKFDGVTTAEDEEKFKDPETGEFVFMWTHGEWVDFSLKVFGGRITINYKGYEMINEELPTGWPALTAPQWLFAGRTGGANAAHWVDDFYVKVFKPSGPIISSFQGAANGFSVSLVDAEGNGLDIDSVEAKFDGSDVAVNKSKSDGETTIAYSTDTPLASGSDHTIQLTYNDEKGTVHVKTLSFSVPKYIILNADSIVSDSVKGESGFIANITQISTEQTGQDSLHNNNVANAEKQLNGEFIDPDIEEPWLNEADLDAEEGWSYYPVWVEWVNQSQDAPAPVGNFSTNNGYEDEYIPGIPGWYDSTDGIAGEYLALLQLDEGAYTLGVNSDDGFRATIGVNYNDILSQEIGVFDGGRGATDSVFDIVVTKSGLYPFRVLWFEGVGGANIEIFSLVDGEKVLINDPDVEGAIKAFIPKGATYDEQITERDATTGRAAVVSITPASGEKMVDPASSIEVVIENGSATSVDQSSVKMSVNGKEVAVDVSKSGDVVTIAHTPDGNLEGEVNTAIVSFKESNGAERSAEWSFEVKVVKPATTLTSFLIDFGGTADNSAGASPDPWISFDNLIMDETADLGDGVTITALDDGFNPNNPAQPGEDAEHDGVVVPQEARNDYFFKITDTAGTTARMRIDGLSAGLYNVTVFEGRTTDGNQVAKIWVGEEPEEENTGNFAQGSATVEVKVIAGQPLWYKHLEDNTGGVSGMIIRKTSEPDITWSVSLNLGADAPDGSNGGTMKATDEAGLTGFAQQNWNNLTGATGSSDEVVALDGSSTGITVEWSSANLWSSTGWGEENIEFEDGGDKTMMTGYLDTNNSSKSTVAISGIPADLSSYDVIVYALGGVASRGGHYWIEDSKGNALTEKKVGDSPRNPTEYVEDPGVDHDDEGNYLVFSGLSARDIVLVASTEDIEGIRAPINGVQLVPAPGALTEPTVVDFGDLSGDASYEFFFNASKVGASTAIAGNNAFAFKLDQWNEQGVFGTTVFGVADNVFTAVEGKSVASVFDRDVHVVLVNDTAAGETRLYVDGDHVGVLDGNFELAGEAKVMGARIEANTDPMGEGSVMHKWAVYNSALSGAEIADLAASVGGGGVDAPALSVVSNGDGTVTITFEGKLQSAPTVNGPWENVDGASPLTIPADQAQQYGRAVN